MTPDFLKKWNNEQEGPRGSAQTQTGTEIEKENQDRAVAAVPGHSGAPDTARPGPHFGQLIGSRSGSEIQAWGQQFMS